MSTGRSRSAYVGRLTAAARIRWACSMQIAPVCTASATVGKLCNRRDCCTSCMAEPWRIPSWARNHDGALQAPSADHAATASHSLTASERRSSACSRSWKRCAPRRRVGGRRGWVAPRIFQWSTSSRCRTCVRLYVTRTGNATKNINESWKSLSQPN